jgi:hypothetical protein
VIGSQTGGRTAAVLYTMVGTCKHLGIDPFAYLREALPGLFALGEKPAVEWLPDRWLLRRTREAAPASAGAGGCPPNNGRRPWPSVDVRKDAPGRDENAAVSP